jgi:alanine-synthesizing transaminase
MTDAHPAPRGMFARRTGWNLQQNRLSQALAAHRAAGKPLIDLTVSNPTECGFTYEGETILRALQNPAALKYEPNPRGLEVARAAVAQYHASRGSAIPVEDIFLTTSTSEAYSFALRALCDPDDEVLIPSPGYPLFDFLADIQDVRLVRYPLVYDYGWQIDFHALEQAITPHTRAAIVVNPNNPTGNYCKAQEMHTLNEICAFRGLAIIADEVFLDFSLTDEPRKSFAQNADSLTFTLSGISKICGLPQMKVAWLILDGPLQIKSQAAERLEVVADTYLSLNAPVQLALPALLATRQAFQQQLLSRVRTNLAELDKQLAAQPHCRRLHVEGGWNAVIQVPVTGLDEDLAMQLLQSAGVYAHPGHFYDFSSNGHFVVSLIGATESFSNGIDLLLQNR